MSQAPRRRIRLWRRASPVAISMLCAAAAASAATLHVRVPSRVPKGKPYTIELTGSFKKSEVSGKAYLISALQYSSKPCAATAQAENDRGPQFYFAPKKAPQKVGIIESSSPFTRDDGFTALRLGARRVCSYLYPKTISASDKTLPIARAGAPFRVTKG